MSTEYVSESYLDGLHKQINQLNKNHRAALQTMHEKDLEIKKYREALEKIAAYVNPSGLNTTPVSNIATEALKQ